MASAPRILLVRLSAIGDCLHAVPAVEALRRAHPDAHIGWLIQAVGHQLVDGHAAVDRFHLFDRKSRGVAALRGLLRLRSEMRSERYEIAVDLQGLTKSAVLARLSGARRVVGFGAPEARELSSWLIRERHPIEKQILHVVDRNLELLRRTELVSDVRVTWSLPEYQAGQPLHRLVEQSTGQRVVVINPGTTWPTKIWAGARFAEVAAALAVEGCAVVVTWAGGQELEMAEELVERAANDAVVLAPPTSLSELGFLLRHSSLLIANDSGPLHLAVALGTPAIGVYGPTDPTRNGPYGFDSKDWPSAAVTLADLPAREIAGSPSERVGEGALLSCQFCWKSACRRGDNACLERLESDAVIERALHLLRSG